MHFKNILASAVAAALTLSSVSAFAAAERIIIDGTAAEIPSDMGSIKEMDDRTFVPVRFVMEYLGCNVDFDDESKMAIMVSPDCTYLVQEGNQKLFVIPNDATDTTPIIMDTSAFIEEMYIGDQSYGRMYIPIRFLAEAIGYEVGWDEESQTVTLNTKE